MNKCIKQLQEALQQELQMYKDILKMAKEKTYIIKKADIKELEKTTEKEQHYIRTMGTFEKIRRSIFANIAEEICIREVNSISELLLHLDEEASKEIDRARDQLLVVIEELGEVNQLNEKLIKQSLDYIDLNIQLMTAVPEAGNNYGQNQGVKPKTSRSLLDMKV